MKKKETKVVILDADYSNDVIGLITLKNKTIKDLEKAFSDYKKRMEDDWYWEGFIDYLRYTKRGWDFDYEEQGSVWSMSV